MLFLFLRQYLFLNFVYKEILILLLPCCILSVHSPYECCCSGFLSAAPILAMRYTHKPISDCGHLNSINVLSIKIISSDKGFPLNVYGNIILRDNLDKKCIYVFSRPNRMDSEFINSEVQHFLKTVKLAFCSTVYSVCLLVDMHISFCILWNTF
jgi:hypothetical protein